MTAAKGYFITGTGTGVGKTFVTCLIAREARRTGKRVFAFKPVETGCTENAGRLIGADQAAICEAAGDWQTGPLQGLYQFAPPVAPSVAAERAGVEIDLDAVATTVARGAALADLVLVEGAGGWRVPVTPTVDMAGLAGCLGYPVVVVARATLGTINHSLLTLEAVERDGQAVAALVLSRHPDDDAVFAIDNARRIAARWKGTVILCTEARDLGALV